LVNSLEEEGILKLVGNGSDRSIVVLSDDDE